MIRLALQGATIALLYAACEAFLAVLFARIYSLEIEHPMVWIHALAALLSGLILVLWLRSGEDDDGRLKLGKELGG